MPGKKYQCTPMRAILSEKRENRFTVALAELLAVREFALKFLTACGIGESELNGPIVVTPQAQAGSGRVDIEIEVANEVVFIEAKLESPLGDKQAETYAGHLEAVRDNENRSVRLILLVPAATKGYYDRQARENIREAGLSDVHVDSISWETVGSIAESTVSVVDGPNAVMLGEFADVIEAYLGQLSHPLTENEIMLAISHETRHAFREATVAMVAIVNALSKELDGVQFTRWSGAQYYIGTNFTFHKQAFWIGLYFEPWLDFGESFLWVQMPGQTPAISPTIKKKLSIRAWRNGLICPLPLSAGVSTESQVGTLTDVAAEFAKATTEDG
jgi:hypothetical protein